MFFSNLKQILSGVTVFAQMAEIWSRYSLDDSKESYRGFDKVLITCQFFNKSFRKNILQRILVKKDFRELFGKKFRKMFSEKI